MEHVSICFLCNNKYEDRFKHFNVKTLAKCQQVFDIRNRLNYKYANVKLPLMPGGPEGYHLKCYRLFTALGTRSDDMLSKEYMIDKYVDRQMLLKTEKQDDFMSNNCMHHDEIIKYRTSECFESNPSLNVQGSRKNVSENIKTLKYEILDERICLFCNQLQNDNGDNELIKVASIDVLQSEAVACRDLDMLRKLGSLQSDILWWHSHCRMSYGKGITVKSASTVFSEASILNSASPNDCAKLKLLELSSEIDIKMDPSQIENCWNVQSKECENSDEKTASLNTGTNLEIKCIFCGKNRKVIKRKINKLRKPNTIESIRSMAIDCKDMEMLKKLDTIDIEHLWYHIHCKNTYGDYTHDNKPKYDELDIEPEQYGSMNKEFCKFIHREIIRNEKSIFLSLLNDIYKDISQSKHDRHTMEQLENKLNQTFDEDLKIVEYKGIKIVAPINVEITNSIFSTLENEYISQRAAYNMRRQVLKGDAEHLASKNIIHFFATIINGASKKNMNPMIERKATLLSRSIINAIFDKNTAKSGRHDMCEGCLANNRKVVPLEQNLESYYSMIEGRYPEVNKNNQTYLPKPALCWECHKEFQNAIAFKKKITQAHTILTTTNRNIIQSNKYSFSNLEISLKTCYDYIFTHDSEDIDVSIIDVPIKVEYVDESQYMDVTVNNDSEQDSNVVLKDVNKEDVEVIITKDVNEQDIDVRDGLVDYDHSYDEDQKLTKTRSVKDQKVKNSKKSAKTRAKNSNAAKRRWHYRNSTKCRLIRWSNKEILKLNAYSKILMKPHELTQWWERERKLMKYKTDLHKCELCVTTHKDESSLEVHMKTFHSQNIGDYECDICHKRAQSKGAIRKHCNTHYYMYHCRLCSYKCWGRVGIIKHCRDDHGKALKCLKCDMKFGVHEKDQFYSHYRLHTEHVCDYCGKKCRKKSTLISHMRNRHLPIVCDICNVRFSRIPALNEHKKLKHVKNPTETAYCVECDLQFDNEGMYKRHCKTSTKHVPKVINKYHPCTGCDKVFAYRWSMLKHYKYHHLQLRNFDCHMCPRSYMCGYQLRQHIDTHHLNMPAPKDKVCDYCGRGFATKNILKNHIRTHTGARPFACDRCPAAFGQRSALVTHVRKTHGVHIMYRDIPLPKDDTL